MIFSWTFPNKFLFLIRDQIHSQKHTQQPRQGGPHINPHLYIKSHLHSSFIFNLYFILNIFTNKPLQEPFFHFLQDPIPVGTI